MTQRIYLKEETGYKKDFISILRLVHIFFAPRQMAEPRFTPCLQVPFSQYPLSIHFAESLYIYVRNNVPLDYTRVWMFWDSVLSSFPLLSKIINQLFSLVLIVQ